MGLIYQPYTAEKCEHLTLNISVIYLRNLCLVWFRCNCFCFSDLISFYFLFLKQYCYFCPSKCFVFSWPSTEYQQQRIYSQAAVIVIQTASSGLLIRLHASKSTSLSNFHLSIEVNNFQLENVLTVSQFSSLDIWFQLATPLNDEYWRAGHVNDNQFHWPSIYQDQLNWP